MKLRKVLLIILGIIVLAAIGVGIWSFSNKSSVLEEQKVIRNINVRPLANDNEKKIGTVIYPGAKDDSKVETENQNQVVNLTTTDSVDGAFNIYYQDILNRYKTYEVTKKDITKNDALNQKARVIVCSGQTGTITITLWPTVDGLTQIKISTTQDFK